MLGLRVLRGAPRKPVMIGAHFILGAAGLEVFVMLLHGTPSGLVLAAGRFGWIAAGLFAAAMFAGISAALFRRSPQTAKIVLAAHVGLGSLGLMVFLAWLASL
jgi:hypothetical protein